MQRAIKSVRMILPAIILVGSLSTCAGLSHDRLVYDEGNLRIGIQSDPSIDASSPTANDHPIRLTAEEIHRLLGLLHVSGYSGTIAGLLVNPKSIPVFKEEELQVISTSMVKAFREAGPRDRIIFSLPNLKAPYNPDRTAGALFVRGSNLFFMLSDHSAFTRTDTGGSDNEKDPSDTRGMKLSLSRPAKEAPLPSGKEPNWSPFESVHLAMNYQDALIADASSTPPDLRDLTHAVQVPPAQQGMPRPEAAVERADDLRLQVRELTNANLDLRARLKGQSQEMATLKEELTRLRRDVLEGSRKARSSRKGSRESPAPRTDLTQP